MICPGEVALLPGKGMVPLAGTFYRWIGYWEEPALPAPLLSRHRLHYSTDKGNQEAMAYQGKLKWKKIKGRKTKKKYYKK